MGRHTAPIPIVPPSEAQPPLPQETGSEQPVGPVTDPRLFDRPLPPARTPARTPASSPVATRPAAPAVAAPPRRPARPVVDAHAPAPAPHLQEPDDDGIDEPVLGVPPRTVRSVLDAEALAEEAMEEEPPRRIPRVRDLVFGGAALAVIGAAVGAMLLPS
jgi:hypothetical protein